MHHRSARAQSLLGTYLPLLAMAFGTGCTSLYDVCNKTGRLPEERCVALDLLDVRGSLAHFGADIRRAPIDHMLVDRLTKNIPTYLLTHY